MEHNFEQQDLGMLLLQEQFRKNPFMLQFHQNVKTSTSDLFNGPSSTLKLFEVKLNCTIIFQWVNLILTPLRHLQQTI